MTARGPDMPRATPIVIGVGSLVPALVAAIALGPVFRPYFDRRPEVLQPDNEQELPR